MERAIIFNVMHYSIHDGTGIRTTVFLKGCQLSCKWCHNPESFDQKPQETFDPRKCIKCGYCSDDAGRKPCPSGAIETIGYIISVRELMKELKKDLLFYEQSGGGVTFSGGEPFYQPEFLIEALAQCKKEYINTAVDTSGYCDTASLLAAAEIADYFLYDIKFFDSAMHKKYCGNSNEIILHNLETLAGKKTKLFIRIPVIPSINDDMKEMTEIFNFIKDMKNIEAVHLLPNHNIQADKYKRIGKEYELSEISGAESPNMDEIKKLFGSRFRTKTGG